MLARVENHVPLLAQLTVEWSAFLCAICGPSLSHGTVTPLTDLLFPIVQN